MTQISLHNTLVYSNQAGGGIKTDREIKVPDRGNFHGKNAGTIHYAEVPAVTCSQTLVPGMTALVALSFTPAKRTKKKFKGGALISISCLALTQANFLLNTEHLQMDYSQASVWLDSVWSFFYQTPMPAEIYELMMELYEQTRAANGGEPINWEEDEAELEAELDAE